MTEERFDLKAWAEELDAALASAEEAAALDPATVAALARIKKQTKT